MEDITNLTGRFLCALPGMGDPRFEKSVIYICSHNSDGAMGLIINKPKDDIIISDLLDDIGIEGKTRFADHPYYNSDTSLRLSETLALTSTKDILAALTSSDAPDLAVLAVGYSGWGGGQLEREIALNAWMEVDAKESLIFENELDDKWTKALATIGVTPEMLSHFGGRA